LDATIRDALDLRRGGARCGARERLRRKLPRAATIAAAVRRGDDNLWRPEIFVSDADRLPPTYPHCDLDAYPDLTAAQCAAESLSIFVLVEEAERAETYASYLRALAEHLLCGLPVDAGTCVLRRGHAPPCVRFMGP